MEKMKEPDNLTMEKINASITNKKPAFLAVLLVEALKECGWKSDDIHFLGVEIINESGML